MAKVEPPEPRSKITDGPKGLQIVIPSKKNIFLILFLAAWLVGWGVGEFMVPTHFFGKDVPTPARIFAAAWLAGWTVGGLVIIYIWLWNVAGKEVVVIGGTSLTVRKEIFSYGRAKEYDLNHVRNLRASPVPFNPWNFSASLQFWGIGGGLIAFDYGARTYRFGASIDEAEANHIIERIKKRYNIPSSLA